MAENITNTNLFTDTIVSLLFPLLTVAFIVIFVGMILGWFSSMSDSSYTSLYSRQEKEKIDWAETGRKAKSAFSEIPQELKNMVILGILAGLILFVLFINMG
jgi:hypothetical protein